MADGNGENFRQTLELLSNIIRDYECATHITRAPGACGGVAADVLAELQRLRFHKLLPCECQFQAMTGVLTSYRVDELVLTNERKPPKVNLNRAECFIMSDDFPGIWESAGYCFPTVSGYQHHAVLVKSEGRVFVVDAGTQQFEHFDGGISAMRFWVSIDANRR